MNELVNPRFFRALADPTRVAILAKLVETGGPCPVGRVAACCTVDLSVVSRHLATLRRAGIVRGVRRGKEVYYSVLYPEIVKTLRSLADLIEECCPSDGAPCCELPNPSPNEVTNHE